MRGESGIRWTLQYNNIRAEIIDRVKHVTVGRTISTTSSPQTIKQARVLSLMDRRHLGTWRLRRSGHSPNRHAPLSVIYQADDAVYQRHQADRCTSRYNFYYPRKTYTHFCVNSSRSFCSILSENWQTDVCNFSAFVITHQTGRCRDFLSFFLFSCLVHVLSPPLHQLQSVKLDVFIA